MRTMIAAGVLAIAPLGTGLAGERPALGGTASLQQTPPATAPATPSKPTPAQPTPAQTAPAKPAATKPAPGPQSPASSAAPAEAAGMEAPKLPPFAGEVVNFDRRGARTVACVDASKVQMAPRPGPDGKPVAPATPPPPSGPPRLRIWVLEREVMQELMTTGGLCDPAWSPDGKTFAAAGLRGVFTFTEPNYEPRVLVAGQLQPTAPGAPAARESRRSGVVAGRRASRVPVQRRGWRAGRGRRREERRSRGQARRRGEDASVGRRADPARRRRARSRSVIVAPGPAPAITVPGD